MGAGARGSVSEVAVDWTTIVSSEDVCRAYPARVRALFGALNLDYPGLEAVKAAVAREAYPAACDALIAYYRTGGAVAWFRERELSADHTEADGVLDDLFTFQEVTARQPRGADGGLNWTHRGPQRDHQWAVFLHRHGYFRSLIEAWRATGDARYAAAFDRLIRDWVVHHRPPTRRSNSGAWTPINPGIRLRDCWAHAFHGFQQADAFTPAGRILFLCSIPEQTDYLIRTLTRGHNFAVIQMSGLGMAGLAFPEFAEAEAWVTFATRELTGELTAQIYPDGAQKELTSTYHWMTLRNMSSFAERARNAGRVLDPSFAQGLERMWQYTAYALAPSGVLPLNNDSDTLDLRAQVTAAADRFARPDWRYIATGGAEGTPPDTPPSRFFPWAGQLVMRSGWDAEAQWAFFDAGPWGTSHQHNDMLHLSVAAYGRDLLVDSGRFAYSGDIADTYRVPYAFHSRGHNVILVDGLGQCAGPQEAMTPHEDAAVSPRVDFCRASFTAGFSEDPSHAITAWMKKDPMPNVIDIAATHTRAVVYLRGLCWLVVDRVACDRPRTLTPLWHFHPACTVALEGASAVTTDKGQGNLRITPIGAMPWQARVVKGQLDPTPQGWYSYTYNAYEESPCVEYTARAEAVSLFGWLLTPGKGEVLTIAVEQLPAPTDVLRVRLTPPGARPIEVAVRMAGEGPVMLSDGVTMDGVCAVLLPGEAAWDFTPR